MALSDEVNFGLPPCASHVPVMHPCTCPTSAYGLLMGLSPVYGVAFYFRFCLINISFRLGSMDLKLLGDRRGFSVIKEDSKL